MAFAEEWNTEGPKTGTLLNPIATNTILAASGSLAGRKKLIVLLSASVAALVELRIFAEDDVWTQQQVFVAAGQPIVIDLSAIPVTFEDPSHVDVINCASLVGTVQASILVEPNA
jgi:hypothetical protein